MIPFINYHEGKRIRAEQHVEAKLNYRPKHGSERYLKFMNDNTCKFSINHPQSINHPTYFCLFTVKSQHVYGDCVEECLDKAMEEK